MYLMTLLLMSLWNNKLVIFLALPGLHAPEYVRACGGCAGGHDPAAGAARDRSHAVAGLPHDRGGPITLHAAALRGRQRTVRARSLPYRTGNSHADVTLPLATPIQPKCNRDSNRFNLLSLFSICSWIAPHCPSK